MKHKHSVFLVVAVLLGALSAWETRLSVFSFLLLVIALASVTRFAHPKKPWFIGALSLATALALFGMTRFILIEALPGIIDARGRASSGKAVSILREFWFYQNAVRRHGLIDADGDGVGSAGRLGELTGTGDVRGDKPLSPAPLSPRFAPRTSTRSGPATEHDGYLFIICVPGSEQEWVTHPDDPVDEEKAERAWVAYAWPAGQQTPHDAAFFIDQHERILESTNRAQADSRKRRLVGQAFAPGCDDALTTNPQLWQPWQGKQPRQELPGLPPSD